jgi:hypothetical protein
MTRIRITVVALLASTPLALAACSSSGGPSAAKGAAGGGSVATSARPAGSAAGSAAAGSATTSTSTSSGSGSGNGGGTGSGDLAAFCKLLGENSKVFMDISAGDTRPGGVDVKKLEADFQTEIDSAPSVIKGDIETIVAFDRQLLDKHIEPSETPELTHAMQHYATWVGKNCVKS